MKVNDMLPALLQCLGMWLIVSIPSALFVGMMMGRMNREPEPLRAPQTEHRSNLDTPAHKPLSSF